MTLQTNRHQMAISRSYFICGERRTGSNLLAGGLKRTGIAGYPDEYFAPKHEEHWTKRLNVASTSEYAAKVLTRTTPNGVFGAKLFWFHGPHLSSRINMPNAFAHEEKDYLADYFPNLRYILLTRRDKVRQAISLHRAQKTGTWWHTPKEPGTPIDPAQIRAMFDFDTIHSLIKELAYGYAGWMQYFKERNIQYLPVVYEDMVEDYEGTIHKVLKWLEITEPDNLRIEWPQYRKQADEISEEWVTRYHEIARGRWSSGHEEPPL